MNKDIKDVINSMDPPAAEKRKCYEAGYGPEVHYDCAVAQLTLFQMLEEAGVNLLLNTTTIEPIMDGNKVKYPPFMLSLIFLIAN